MARELPAAIELRHRLHSLAEVSHREETTRQMLADALHPLPVELVAGESLLARRGSDDALGIVLRAEMDALPLAEETGVAFACRSGAMHACGHDVHMAALVAAYRVLEVTSKDAGVAFSALFQHSEEAYPSGGKEVLEAAVLKGANAVIASHVHPDVPWGAVTADPGPINASSDFFRIVVRGAGGHAAYPHRARDAIAALCQIVGSLQQVTSRSIDPLHGSVMSIGFIKGGSTHNALPELAEVGGTFRALWVEDRTRIRSLVEEVAGGIAAAFGCGATVEITSGEPPTDNDERLALAAREELVAFGLAIADPLRSCGSDDFGYFSQALPSLMSFVGVGGALAEEVPLHHPRFLPPDEAVEAVARSQLATFGAAAKVFGHRQGPRG
jgi:amidohydrolase